MTIFYYRNRRGALVFTGAGTTEQFYYYTVRDAFRAYKKQHGIKRATLIKTEV
jgi:hypothetical protein